MPRIPKALVAILAIGLSTVAAIAQVKGSDQSPRSGGTGLIMGRVVEATTNAPIPGATVQLATGPNDTVTVATDAAGQFVLGALKAGTFHLDVRKAGYAQSGFGQRRPNTGRVPLTLADGERRGDVTLRLWKYGAIAGAVVDEMGEPVIGVIVTAFARVWSAGRPVLTEINTQAQTDDRGFYRLSRLVAGDYVVAIVRQQGSTPASVIDEITRLQVAGDKKALQAFMEPLFTAEVPLWRPGESNTVRIGSSIIQLEPPMIRASGNALLIYPTQFYPAAASASSARAIAVVSGQDVTGIDLTLRPVRAVTVSGRVIDGGGPVAYFPLRLLPSSSTDFLTERLGPGAATITDAAGRFTFPTVEPGEYVVRGLKGPASEFGVVFASGVEASAGGGIVISTGGSVEFPANPGGKRQPTLHGSASVSVADRAVDDVTIALRNGIRLTGRVAFSGAGQAPTGKALEKISLELDPVDGRSSGSDFAQTGTVTDDGRFETVELPPGRYFLRVSDPPAGWFLDSIRQGDRDVSDQAIDIGASALAPLTIRFTDKPTVINGSVRTAAGESVGDTTLVVAFPVDRTRWIDYGAMTRRLASAGTTRESAFELRDLPAGEYFVAALRDSFLGDWRAPANLSALTGSAERITIMVGETRSLSLTLGSGR